MSSSDVDKLAPGPFVVRSEAVRFAAASCALEGLLPSDAARIRAQQFLEGVIDLDELIAQGAEQPYKV